MKAIILAAGLSSRLHPLTAHTPKCLLDLHGKTLLVRQLDLLQACGIERVTVVIGHHGELIRKHVGLRVEYTEYPDFAHTNNLWTLQHCGHILNEEVMILFSDVLVEAEALERCAAVKEDFAALVDLSTRRPDTMRVRVMGRLVTDIGAHVPVASADGNFVGIAKLSSTGASLLRTELDRMKAEGGFEQSYYTHALLRLVKAGQNLHAVPVGSSQWLEVDTLPDYRSALARVFYVKH